MLSLPNRFTLGETEHLLHNINYVKTNWYTLSMPRVVDHQQRKTKIASAACLVIARDGLESVTLANVGRQANCTTGTITHYFHDKEEVLTAALNHAIKAMSARMMRRLKKNPEDALGFLCETLPLGRRGRAEIKVWFCFWSRAMHDNPLARSQLSIHQRWRTKVERLLCDMQTRGEIVFKHDVEDEAEALCAMINGLGLRATLDPHEWPATRQIRLLENYLSRLQPA